MAVASQSNKVQAIILDRDGIVNEIVLRDGKVSSPLVVDEFVIRPDFSQFMAAISPLDISLFVASNQPDVKRGQLAAVSLAEMTERIKDQFPQILEVLYCRHDDGDRCSCRKPKPGLLMTLIDSYGLPTEATMVVGDSHKDIEAGSNAGLKTVFLRTSYNQRSVQICQPDITVDSLVELAAILTEKHELPL